jgi:putative ABC transport system permease protein
VVATQAPQLTLRTVGDLFGQDTEVGSGATRRLRSPVVVVQHPGCSPADMFRGVDDLGTPLPGCSSVGTNGAGAHPGVAVVDADTLARLMPLPATARRVLAGGGMLVADPALVSNGELEVIEGHVDMDPTGAGAPTRAVVDRQRHVPAVVVDPVAWRTAFPDLREGAAVTPGTAAAMGWPASGWATYLFSATGTVSEAEETAISEHLSDTAMLYVERGFHDDRRTMLLIIFTVAGLLVLVAALVATALSLSESRADMATLAAVGADRQTRRLVAGSQALVVGLVGCVLGLALGMVPGLAVTWPLTAHTLDPVTHRLVPAPVVISIPWAHLVAVTLGVPVLAAILAAAAVRRAPMVTRRLT